MSESNVIIKTGAGLNRHNSKQDVATPDDFLAAVQLRFGRITWDLAASSENDVTGKGLYFGPGSTYAEDSLAENCTWSSIELNWLNPEFNNITPWAKKSSESKAPILFLVPGSVGSNWFDQYVHRKSYVLSLSPRLIFKDSKDPYSKDLILCCFGFFGFTGFDTWRWK